MAKAAIKQPPPQQEENPEEALLQQRALAVRLLAARRSKDSLIDFTRFTMPDAEQPGNAELSRYDPQYFHRALAQALEDVEAGKISRLIITFPPRHGKSELSSKRFPAWFIGRDPYRYCAVCTYNQTFAEDIGRKVREIIQTPAYRQIFPTAALRKGSAAADRLETTEGGAIYFLGRGGTITGRGADLIIIDDPIKNSEEARSETVRNALWEWFSADISSRFMTDTGAMIVIQTRWHEDDLVGRLTDPTNPHYDAEEASRWKIINIPAIAEDGDVLGRKAGEPLWPQRFGLQYLEDFKRRDARAFSALYQQKPTPDDGDLIKKEMLKSYRPDQLPKNLRIYAASDHAVGTKQEHDKTCLLIVGVDDMNRIWVLDAFWQRARADKVVDAMIALMKKWKPITWWAESGHISKSIGPFLYKRMTEEKVFVYVQEQVPSKDKVTRAQSIIGRMAMGMVYLPLAEPWYEDARQELLKFPNARHDDFVDTIAHIGLGLEKQLRAAAPAEVVKGPKVGTLGWVKYAHTQRQRATKIAQRGW